MFHNLYQQLPVSWLKHFSLCGTLFVEKIEKSLENVSENLIKWHNENPQRDIFPLQEHWFEALKHVNPTTVKVVILGQDPYHGSRQAHGLAFSVMEGEKIAPSLKNIFKELILEQEIQTIPNHGNLTHWVKQGVLLLNHTLTVGNNEANSHAKMGWGNFTDLVIESLALNPFVIYCLWGHFAHKKEHIISNSQHVILKAGHPSPLSVRYFAKCGHFTQINNLLHERKITTIDWKL